MHVPHTRYPVILGFYVQIKIRRVQFDSWLRSSKELSRTTLHALDCASSFLAATKQQSDEDAISCEMYNVRHLALVRRIKLPFTGPDGVCKSYW